MRFRFSRGVAKTAMVLVSGACLGMLGLVSGDSANAASWDNGGTAPVGGDISLTFAINQTLTLDIQTDGTAAPTTALTGAALDAVNWGTIAITPTGCLNPPTTGSCELVSAVSPTQVNLVAALQAHATCAGFSRMGLAIYRENTTLLGLPTGRVRFVAGTPAQAPTAPTAVTTADWTADGTGTAVQETAAGTADGSLTSILIPSVAGNCTETSVDYNLAARVLATDTAGSTTPVTHRLFAQ